VTDQEYIETFLRVFEPDRPDYQEIHARCRELAQAIVRLCPEGSERTRALELLTSVRNVAVTGIWEKKR